jgi:hypothetical protein
LRLYTRLPTGLKPFFDQELTLYQAAYASNNPGLAWHHLERAHILGQRYPLAHSYVHWKMLLFGIRIKSGKEVLGQIPRLIFGGVKSFVGTVPVGNPGGANVPPLKPFAITPELQAIFRKAGIQPG